MLGRGCNLLQVEQYTILWFELHNVISQLKRKRHIVIHSLQHTRENNKGKWYGGQSIPHPMGDLACSTESPSRSGVPESYVRAPVRWAFCRGHSACRRTEAQTFGTCRKHEVRTQVDPAASGRVLHVVVDSCCGSRLSLCVVDNQPVGNPKRKV
jgi:hypothetical protein